jgi:hypothetical protein
MPLVLEDFVINTEIFIFFINIFVVKNLALGPTQFPIPGLMSQEVKWPECEGDHIPPSAADIMNMKNFIPPYINGVT